MLKQSGTGNVKNESSHVAEALDLKESRVGCMMGKKPRDQAVKGSECLLSTRCEGLGRHTLRSLDFTLVNSEEPPNIF